MQDVWNTKIPVELTIRELEDIIIMLRVANMTVRGNVRSEIEEKLENIVTKAKMNIS